MSLRRIGPYFCLFALLALANAADGEQINFENYSGPSLFTGAASQTLFVPTSIGYVQVSGGMILTAENNLPADQTSVYASASYDDVIVGYSNPITLKFPQPIQNFFVDVYNGNTDNVDYTVADNAGHSATFNLLDNFSGGQSQIGFAATGNVVTVTAGPNSGDFAWDFSIDNIGFNESLPPTLAPEPVSTGLLGAGLLGCALFRRKHCARLFQRVP